MRRFLANWDPEKLALVAAACAVRQGLEWPGVRAGDRIGCVCAGRRGNQAVVAATNVRYDAHHTGLRRDLREGTGCEWRRSDCDSRAAKAAVALMHQDC